MRAQIPVPYSGGLILSYTCNARCGQCMYACSPEWDAHWMSDHDLELILDQLSRTILPAPSGADTISLAHGLHFTGGEPFLNFELLVRAVETAEEMGIPSTFVETNSYWAVNKKTAQDKLKLLKAKGLKGIMLSVNPFYLEYVPFERTEAAIEASYELFGENMIIYQWEYYKKFKQLGMKGIVPFEDYLEIENRDEFARNVEFFLTGRSAYTMEERLPGFFPKYPPEILTGQPCMPEFLRNWHNHFDNYGNYMPGYCGGISLGDCRNLDDLLENGIEVHEGEILYYLITGDLGGVFELALDAGYAVQEEGYFGKCHLCADLRKHLSRTGEHRELAPQQFYEQLK